MRARGQRSTRKDARSTFEKDRRPRFWLSTIFLDYERPPAADIGPVTPKYRSLNLGSIVRQATSTGEGRVRSHSVPRSTVYAQ